MSAAPQKNVGCGTLRWAVRARSLAAHLLFPCSCLCRAVFQNGHGTDVGKKEMHSAERRSRQGGQRSRQPQVSVGATGAREGKQAIVDELTAQPETVCFVNASDPSQAVLGLSLPLSAWITGLVTLAITIGVIWVRKRLLPGERQPSHIPNDPPGESRSSGTTTGLNGGTQVLKVLRFPASALLRVCPDFRITSTGTGS